MIRSINGGKQWEPPLPLKRWISHPDHFGPGMCALGVINSGEFVLVCSKGVFVSQDLGLCWEQLPVSLGVERRFANAGPKILNHPDMGLLLPFHTRSSCDTRGPAAGPSFELRFFVSTDSGRSWREAGPFATPGFAMAEPSIFQWNHRPALFSRNHSDGLAGSPMIRPYSRRYNYFAQLTALPLPPGTTTDGMANETRSTNVFCQTMDTPDVDYNPVSGRIEAVIPKRNHGFPYTDHSCRTLSLWSIDPEDFFDRNQARWRFDGVLLRSRYAYGGTPGESPPAREGLHPAGAVMDQKAGVQHVFFFCGDCSHIYGGGLDPRPRNPPERATGIFRLTRTLDSEALRRVLLREDRRAGCFEFEESFRSLRGWSWGGGPLRWEPDAQYRSVRHRVLPEATSASPQPGPGGLVWNLEAPGWLIREDVVIPDHYHIDFRVRLPESDAFDFGICTVRGALRFQVVFRHDRVIGYGAQEGREIEVGRIGGRGLPQTWSLRVDGAGARLYCEERFIGPVRSKFESIPCGNEAPLSLFLRSSEEARGKMLLQKVRFRPDYG